jgi:hypothetical protein
MTILYASVVSFAVASAHFGWMVPAYVAGSLGFLLYAYSHARRLG